MYKVLIADDEVWIGFGIKKLIHKSGQPFTVIGEAPNGIRAYEMVKKEQPDLDRISAGAEMRQVLPVMRSGPLSPLSSVSTVMYRLVRVPWQRREAFPISTIRSRSSEPCRIFCIPRV